MSRPTSLNVRSRRAGRAGALVLAAAVLLGACTQTRQVPERYGDTTRENFTEGCIEGLIDQRSEAPGEAYSREDATAICECSYEAIEDGVPFEEFKEIIDQQEEQPGALPDAIADKVLACHEELS